MEDTEELDRVIMGKSLHRRSTSYEGPLIKIFSGDSELRQVLYGLRIGSQHRAYLQCHQVDAVN